MEWKLEGAWILPARFVISGMATFLRLVDPRKTIFALCQSLFYCFIYAFHNNWKFQIIGVKCVTDVPHMERETWIFFKKNNFLYCFIILSPSISILCLPIFGDCMWECAHIIFAIFQVSWSQAPAAASSCIHMRTSPTKKQFCLLAVHQSGIPEKMNSLWKSWICTVRKFKSIQTSIYHKTPFPLVKAKTSKKNCPYPTASATTTMIFAIDTQVIIINSKTLYTF